MFTFDRCVHFWQIKSAELFRLECKEWLDWRFVIVADWRLDWLLFRCEWVDFLVASLRWNDIYLGYLLFKLLLKKSEGIFSFGDFRVDFLTISSFLDYSFYYLIYCYSSCYLNYILVNLCWSSSFRQFLWLSKLFWFWCWNCLFELV